MKNVYVANCIECGEKFIATFKTLETDKKKLYDMGMEIANGWGGECTSVRKWKPKQLAKVFDKIEGKYVEVTLKPFKKFMEKYPTSTRYDYSKIEYFEEEPPTDIWDSDLSDEDNLKEVKRMRKCCKNWRNETDLYDEEKKKWYIICNKCFKFKRYATYKIESGRVVSNT